MGSSERVAHLEAACALSFRIDNMHVDATSNILKQL